MTFFLKFESFHQLASLSQLIHMQKCFIIWKVDSRINVRNFFKSYSIFGTDFILVFILSINEYDGALITKQACTKESYRVWWVGLVAV